MDKLTLKDKLMSTKRWGTIIGALIPLIGQLATGEIGWLPAILTAAGVIAVGLGVIGAEDVTRIKANAIRAAAESDAKATASWMEGRSSVPLATKSDGVS